MVVLHLLPCLSGSVVVIVWVEIPCHYTHVLMVVALVVAEVLQQQLLAQAVVLYDARYSSVAALVLYGLGIESQVLLVVLRYWPSVVQRLDYESPWCCI